jgi:uncharacterized protein (TIGR02453 family)
MAGFAGFPKGMAVFFRGLSKNNNRDWFQAHKQDFDENVKAPMVEFVGALNAELAKAAPQYVTDPKRAIYRIYRDTRFSKDKTPYKDHLGATFSPNSPMKHGCGGLYVGVSHDVTEVAAGVYMPEPEQMLLIRTLLAERHVEFRKMTESKSYRALMGELRGEQLQRVPKGFPASHPAAGLLRRKAWYFYEKLDPELATSSKLLGEIKKRFLASIPMLDFLNEPVLAAAKKKERAAKMLA